MKFALVLLLTGSLLVASSHLKPWPKYCAVRHVPLPIFWPHSSPYGDSDADSGDSDYVAGPGSADGRTWASGSRNAVQQRFGFQPFYRTTTTVTSTVLTAIISSCIPLNQFAGQQQVAIIQQVTSIQQDTSIQQNTSIQQPANNQQRANNVVLLSTNPCAREKRELAEDFNPSPVER